MDMKIRNCNNIDFGEIKINEGCLNIKYAINGTGKSTIAKAIEWSLDQEKLNSLTPYKYMNDEPITDDHMPIVEITNSIRNIAIFDENYVNQFIFLPTDLLENSFEIFIKTPDYDLQMNRIQDLVQDVQNAFRDNPDLDELISDLTAFIAGFGKAQSGYSKAGSIGKGLAKGNKIANIPPTLTNYTPYIQSAKTSKWLAWQVNGEEYLDVAEQCPYCAKELPETQKQTVKQVSIEYNSKYVAELQKTLNVFRSLYNYFTDEVKEAIEKLSNSSTELTDLEINFLKEIKNQVVVLNDKLIKIKSLHFETLKDVDAVLATLQKEQIDLSLLGHINSSYTNEKISIVNNALKIVIQQAGQLQGEINKQKELINRTIENYSKEINGFLESAGYKYSIDLIEDPNFNTYKMVLKNNDTNTQIDNIKQHLSYGERNAFALVLFMYRTLKDAPDIVILDDPISSFDDNKKYAIMEMLFQGAGSFQGKTVIMLTHDFDPVVDLIHTTSIRCRFCPVPVASFLYNSMGTLSEKTITPSDIKSFYEIANMNICGEIDEINKLIYLRRRLEACGYKNLAWQLISNVFHPEREVPTIGGRSMSPEEVLEATEMIKSDIPNFEYNRIYARAHDLKQMINLYKTSCDYEKIQLYRIINYGKISDTVFKKFIDEVYHIENDNLFQLNPSEYPTIPNYIIQLCDNGIELLDIEINHE